MCDLTDTIESVTGDGKLLTIQPGGNHGDSLIYFGMRKILDESELDWIPFGNDVVRADFPRNFLWYHPARSFLGFLDRLRYIRHRLNRKISAVYIHGGGNFNELWEIGIQCFDLVSSVFNCPIIVGPQSVLFESTNPDDLFRKVTNDVHFYCRERYSYNIIKEVDADCLKSVALEDDTALFLDPEDLPIETMADDYSLLVFRGDQESVSPTIRENINSPAIVRDISVDEPTFERFCNTAAKAGKIHTDRLHGAILGTILGKPVTFYGNSYHKSRGVYEYSLSDNTQVKFIESETPLVSGA